MLPGIRLYCGWSKLREWAPAGLPLIPPHACGQGRDWCSARGQSAYSMTPLKGETFSLPLLVNTTYPNRFWGNIRHGQFDRQPRAPAAPMRQEKPLSQLPISECAGRQTGVTYQHDIVHCLPQSNENFNCISLSFFIFIGSRTVHQSMHTHTVASVRKSAFNHRNTYLCC